jgi:hypothetical protein
MPGLVELVTSYLEEVANYAINKGDHQGRSTRAINNGDQQLRDQDPVQPIYDQIDDVEVALKGALETDNCGLSRIGTARNSSQP